MATKEAIAKATAPLEAEIARLKAELGSDGMLLDVYHRDGTGQVIACYREYRKRGGIIVYLAAGRGDSREQTEAIKGTPLADRLLAIFESMAPVGAA